MPPPPSSSENAKVLRWLAAAAILVGLIGYCRATSMAHGAEAPVATADCEITGYVPASLQEAVCGIATSVHGERDSGILIIMATQSVALTLATQSLQAKNALLTLHEAWRTRLGRNSARLEVHYDRVHIATVRNRWTGEAYVEFH